MAAEITVEERTVMVAEIAVEERTVMAAEIAADKVKGLHRAAVTDAVQKTT